VATTQPNILLITTDQQRFDAAGGAGPRFLRTPHFDQLRREGLTFTSAYADCPSCVPSRVSIMTGQFVTSHGMARNGQTSTVMGRERTLPAYMRALGYQTAAIGKMHFGPQRLRHGFDEMILPDDYYREMIRRGASLQPMRHGLGQNELYPTMATVPESQTLTNWIAEQCLEYIRVRRDPTVPFFLWCSFSKPHPPLDPPEPYYSMYRGCAIAEPVYGDWSDDEHCPYALKRGRQAQSYDLLPPEIIREARSAYYGLITQIDYNLGRIFAGLQDVDLFNETLILYTSDHGEYLGDHHMGSKGFFHEPSAHVPFVLRPPRSWDRRAQGTTVGDLATLADILPTLVTAAGGTPSADCDGQDLLAAARGELDQPRRHLEFLLGGAPALTRGARPLPASIGLTDGRWKYLWYPQGGAEQLFDLGADPLECHNLAGIPAFAGQAETLRQELVRRHQDRSSAAVADGRLVARPVPDDTVADRRSRSWAGYHTEYTDVDVRH
jgi:arylsulfatase A-like enzyme